MIDTRKVSGENFSHKLAAIFELESEALRAVESLSKSTSVSRHQVFVVRPNDDHPGWEIEPEDRGIWRTLVRSHVSLGIAGAVFGALAFAVLYFIGIPFIVSNALAAAGLIIALSTVFGLMLGGLITLRPDHVPYVVAAQSALEDGKIVVAIHAESSDQLKAAQSVLNQFRVKMVGTL